MKIMYLFILRWEVERWQLCVGLRAQLLDVEIVPVQSCSNAHLNKLIVARCILQRMLDNYKTIIYCYFLLK